MTADDGAPEVRERTIGEYLDAVASAAPTPGGGSVGGVVAALAAALGEMVGNLTKPGPDGLRPDALETALVRLAALRSDAASLGTADEQAYASYRLAASLPKSSEEEKAMRTAAIQDALRTATEVPLALAVCCAEMLAELVIVAELGNRHALSDALLGSLLAKAAGEGALINVRGNAGLITDAAFAQRATDAAKEIERTLADRRDAVVNAARR